MDMDSLIKTCSPADPEAIESLYTQEELDDLDELYTRRDAAAIREIRRMVGISGPRLPYHNAGHMRDVARACERYALMMDLPYDERRDTRFAGEGHDMIYVSGRAGENEKRTAESMGRLLHYLGYGPEVIHPVKGIILMTDISNPENKPRTTPEMIIRGADIDNLGRDDFFEKTELLRLEEGVAREEWYKRTLAFMEGVRYFTDSARELRGPGLKANIERMREIVGYDERVF